MHEREQELTELFTHFEALVRREMAERFRSHSPFMNPHRGQGRILSILKMEPEISQKELSDLLDMSKQGLAELLTKLEAAGYITRTPSPEDGRMMIVRLTKRDARRRRKWISVRKTLTRFITTRSSISLPNTYSASSTSWKAEAIAASVAKGAATAMVGASLVIEAAGFGGSEGEGLLRRRAKCR